MTRRRVLVLILGVAAAIAMVSFSCSERPHERVRQARSAIAEARDLHKAESWAPNEMASAVEAIEAAEKELGAQDRRFGIMRDYAKASELFERAKEDAEAAGRAAQAGRAEAERTARETMEAAGSAIGHAQATLMIAPVHRDARDTIERIQLDLGQAETRLLEVQRLILADQYKEATVLAEKILDDVSSLIRAASRAARK